jgi:hypothetical protein
MTIVFLKLAPCLAAVSQGAHAVDNVNEVNVKLPIVSGSNRARPLAFIGFSTHQVTTSYTTADETEMLASLDTPINRDTWDHGEDRAVRGPTAKTGESGWTGRIGRHLKFFRPPCTCRLLQGVTMVWWLRHAWWPSTRTHVPARRP